MSTGIIILAGGIGERLGQPIPKQYVLLGGKPIIVHVLDKVEELNDIARVVITCPAGYLEETRALLAHRNLGSRFECIEGGKTRQESVYAGLIALAGIDTVIIHEAVRPFVTVEMFRTLIDSEHENAIFGTPIPFTVLEGGEFVTAILDRERLVNVQLPQKFAVAPLREAHEAAQRDGATFTEDASMLFRYNATPIRILPGSDRNIKITNPSDLVIGEAIYDEYVLGKA